MPVFPTSSQQVIARATASARVGVTTRRVRSPCPAPVGGREGPRWEMLCVEIHVRCWKCSVFRFMRGFGSNSRTRHFGSKYCLTAKGMRAYWCASQLK